MNHSWRRWTIVGVAAILLAVVGSAVFLASRDDGSNDSATTTSLEPGPLQEAVLRADVRVDSISDEEIGALIEDLCATRDGARLGERVVALGLTDVDEVRSTIEGVGRGAVLFCSEVPADEPQLLNDAYNAAVAELEG